MLTLIELSELLTGRTVGFGSSPLSLVATLNLAILGCAYGIYMVVNGHLRYRRDSRLRLDHGPVRERRDACLMYL